MGKSTINGHVQWLFVCSPEGIKKETEPQQVDPRNHPWSLRVKFTGRLPGPHLRPGDIYYNGGALQLVGLETPSITVPSGKHTKNCGKSPFLMGESTI